LQGPEKANGGTGSHSIAEVDESEILQASIKAGSVAQIVVAAVVVIWAGLLLKLVMVTGSLCFPDRLRSR
jgi:hypothetical protein